MRRKHGITQEQLAHLLGVSFSTVNAWESNKRIPQKRMQELITALAAKEMIPLQQLSTSLKNKLVIQNGLLRSGSGFVSSILDYQGCRDPLEYTHGIGRWYGSLPSFLVRDLIKFLITDFHIGDPVLVNFSGSGTVALEFGLCGCQCFAVDINPLAVLLTSTKTNPMSSNIVDDTRNRLDSILAACSTSNIAEITGSFTCKHSNNLLLSDSKWLDTSLRLHALHIIREINALADFNVRKILIVSLLNIIADHGNIDKRCTNHYVYRKHEFSIESFVKSYRREVNKVLSSISTLSKTRNYVKPEISLADTGNLGFEDNYFSAVFSHPPYGNTINYFSISRISLSALELLDISPTELWPDSLKGNMLPWVQKYDQSSGTTRKYKLLVRPWIREIYRVLKKNGILLVIIGDTREDGSLLHHHTAVIDEAEEIGFSLKELFVWATNHKSGMHIRRKGNHIDHNYVLIFQKK